MKRRLQNFIITILGLFLGLCVIAPFIIVIVILSTNSLSWNGGGLNILPNDTRTAIDNQARARTLAIENLERSNKAALAYKQASDSLPYRVAADITLWFTFIATLAGLGFGGVVWLMRRAASIYPNSAGLFPVVRLSVGGATVLHDVNRSLTASTVYAPMNSQGVAVLPVLAESQAQLRTSLAGAFIQSVAAANQARKLTAQQQRKQSALLDAPPQLQLQEPEVQARSLPSLVQLRKLLPEQVTLDALTIGLSNSGAVTENLHNMMHVLAVGASGWGKSTWLRSLLYQLAVTRDNVQVVAVDVSGSEFHLLDGWSKLLYPVAKTTEEAIAVLSAVSEEIAHRRKLFAHYPLASNLMEYNEMSGDDLPPIICFIDEGTNLLNQSGVGDKLRDAVQTSRQYGVYNVVSGQSVKAQVMDTQTRDNFSARLCFRVSPSSSRVVLEGDGRASDLSIKGRAYAQLPGRELEEVQAGYISRAELYNVLTNGGPVNRMPQIIEAVSEDDEKEQRIIELYKQGFKQSEIEREVYGFNGGAAYRKVKSVINSTTTHE